MLNIRRIAVVSALAFGTIGIANAESTTMTVETVIATPITVASTQSLNFGTIGVDVAAVGGSLAKNSSNTDTPTGVAVLTAGTVGIVTIDGQANEDVTVTVTEPANLGVAGLTVAIENADIAVAGVAGTWNAGTCTLDGTGNCNLDIGGTLTIGANVPAATYNAATATIDVVYQ